MAAFKLENMEMYTGLNNQVSSICNALKCMEPGQSFIYETKLKNVVRNAIVYGQYFLDAEFKTRKIDDGNRRVFRVR